MVRIQITPTRDSAPFFPRPRLHIAFASAVKIAPPTVQLKKGTNALYAPPRNWSRVIQKLDPSYHTFPNGSFRPGSTSCLPHGAFSRSMELSQPQSNHYTRALHQGVLLRSRRHACILPAPVSVPLRRRDCKQTRGFRRQVCVRAMPRSVACSLWQWNIRPVFDTGVSRELWKCGLQARPHSQMTWTKASQVGRVKTTRPDPTSDTTSVCYLQQEWRRAAKKTILECYVPYELRTSRGSVRIGMKPDLGNISTPVSIYTPACRHPESHRAALHHIATVEFRMKLACRRWLRGSKRHFVPPSCDPADHRQRRVSILRLVCFGLL